MDTLERVQQRTRKMIMGLEHLSYEERLREFMFRDNLISVNKYLKGGHKGDRAGLFSTAKWQYKKEWAQNGTQETLSDYQWDIFLLHGTGTGCPERLWRSSKATWRWPWAPSSGHPCLGSGWSGWTQMSLPTSASLRFCEIPMTKTLNWCNHFLWLTSH